MADAGLAVRRFPSSAAALAAQAPIESDGLGASLMPRVCAWCKVSLGAVVCEPAMAGCVSHGICPACSEILREEARQLTALIAENEATAAQASTPPGAEPLQVTGTADSAGVMIPPQVVEHARARPVASSLFWTITGLDFGRSIAWAKRQPNSISAQIRAKLGRIA
jgi:hypothetical protein